MSEQLPTIPNDVTDLLWDWIQNKKGIKNSKKGLLTIKRFYDSLGIKHNSNKAYYRGLGISGPGFIELITRGSVKLKNRASESWSCMVGSAGRFIPADNKIKDGCGILLRKRIPENKVIVDLQKMVNHYDSVRHDDSSDIFIKYGPMNYSASWHLLNNIDAMKECELVTQTICTDCNQADMIIMKFKNDERLYNSKTEYILGFLYNLDPSEVHGDSIYNWLDRIESGDASDMGKIITLTKMGIKFKKSGRGRIRTITIGGWRLE